MTVHLLKLCVGVDTVQDLKAWQADKLKRLKQARKTVELCHRTLQMPRRRDEVLDGGSLYWVIKGFVVVRQRVLDLRSDVKDDGMSCCGIVLHPELIGTRVQPRRPFQGWRYLDATDAPLDARTSQQAEAEMPKQMREHLLELRLIDC
jgi:hypothetical protein